MAPSAMSFTAVPEAKAAPPVETWMIPSLPLSASPLRTAFAVLSDVTLTAGYANFSVRARSSIAQ